MSEWKEYRLGDVVEVLDAKRVPLSAMQRQSMPGIYPYYGAQSIIDYVNDYIFDGEYLILAEDGENLKSRKSPIAQIVQGKFWLNNHAHIMRANGKANLYLLAAVLNRSDISGYITGSAQPKLNQENMSKIKIFLPSPLIQQKIADILSSLDEKIETNRKINARLEELAQAIFKSWFIDFEPFGGKMPEDWKTSAVEDFFKIDIGKTPPRKESQWFSLNNKDVTWVSISDMGKYGMFISDSSELLTYEAVKKYNITIVPQNTILLSFKLTIGRVCIANSTLTTNEAIARFRLNSSFEREFLYLFLKQFDYNSLGSTSSIATAVNSKIIKGMPIFIPHEKVLKDFSALISPIFNRIESLTKESARLAALRDTLLPKLMSGELIPEI